MKMSPGRMIAAQQMFDDLHSCTKDGYAVMIFDSHPEYQQQVRAMMDIHNEGGKVIVNYNNDLHAWEMYLCKKVNGKWMAGDVVSNMEGWPIFFETLSGHLFSVSRDKAEVIGEYVHITDESYVLRRETGSQKF